MTGTPDPGGLSVAITAQVGALSLRASFELGPGPTFVIGPNGSGKTTLLRALAGAVRLASGRVTLGGRVLDDVAARVRRPPEARQIAYLPQDYGLFPHLDVRANVAFGAHGGTAEARRDRAHSTLEDLGIADLATVRPAALSGGQRQRVALARALATDPAALLLDEPLAALDLVHRGKVRSFLARRLGALDIPALVVTHERADLDAFPDTQVIVLEEGAVVGQGSWTSLLASPPTDLVRALAAG